jgi:hypothetical protein
MRNSELPNGGPEFFGFRASPTGVRTARSGSVSVSVGLAVESAARAAQGGALKTYRKFSQQTNSHRCLDAEASSLAR